MKPFTVYSVRYHSLPFLFIVLIFAYYEKSEIAVIDEKSRSSSPKKR